MVVLLVLRAYPGGSVEALVVVDRVPRAELFVAHTVVLGGAGVAGVRPAVPAVGDGFLGGAAAVQVPPRLVAEPAAVRVVAQSARALEVPRRVGRLVGAVVRLDPRELRGCGAVDRRLPCWGSGGRGGRPRVVPLDRGGKRGRVGRQECKGERHAQQQVAQPGELHRRRLRLCRLHPCRAGLLVRLASSQ